MAHLSVLREEILSGQYDAAFSRLYPDPAPAVRERYLSVLAGFEERFGAERDVFLFSAPGRTELGGNHTDHNGGKVLAGAVNRDVICAAAKAEGESVMTSLAFGESRADASDLLRRPEELGSSQALMRGVMAGFEKHGYATGNFVAFTHSTVPGGSGISSSAAFEVLLGTILNHFYNNGAISPEEIAVIGRFAEAEYFGKPCGVMDQLASALGGIRLFDLTEPTKPLHSAAPAFPADSHILCLVKVGEDHADLTDCYAALPARMKRAAAVFGKERLSQVDEAEFFASLPRLREETDDDCVLAAVHFYHESRRATQLADALERCHFPAYLDLVRASGHSSFEHLGNVRIPVEGSRQGACLALAVAEGILGSCGAVRIHGGGFGGTVQCYVPRYLWDKFASAMEALFGKDCLLPLCFRADGACLVEPSF